MESSDKWLTPAYKGDVVARVESLRGDFPGMAWKG
jgi:hypothetical protein